MPPPQLITEVTRQRIFDALAAEGISWVGRLDDVRFLSRLYDLKALPSEDPWYDTVERDIIQHRFNNDDLPDGWVFEDSRFGLASGPDEVLLAFLAEMLHPVVRPDVGEVARLVAVFNEALVHDGFEIVRSGAISGAPVFRGRRLNALPAAAMHSAGRDVIDHDREATAVPDEIEQEQALIARYGEIRTDGLAGSAAQIVELLAGYFDLAGLPQQPVMPLVDDSAAVGVEINGAFYVVDVLCPADAASFGTLERIARAVSGRPTQVTRIALCMAGYAPGVVDRLSTGQTGGCILLDAEHLDALLSGLISTQDTFEQCRRRALLDGTPYVSVAELISARAISSPRLHTPDRMPPP